MSGMSFGQMAGLGGISAGSNLIGGVINHVLGSKQEKEMWKKNYDAQKEFAQNSIQWRVQDAEKAGIHPLYAMGNSPGYTPSSSMSTGSLGDAVANAGNAFAQTMGQLQMHNAYLQNMKLRSDVESQQLDNQNKELSLYNKLLDKIQGQKNNPMANWATGQTEQNITIIPSPSFRHSRQGDPGQLEGEVSANYVDLNKINRTMWNSYAAQSLPYDKKKYDARLGIGFGGITQDLYEKGKVPKSADLIDKGIRVFRALKEASFLDLFTDRDRKLMQERMRRAYIGN